MPAKRINLLDYDQDALKSFFVANNEKPFRAVQLMKWIYHQGERDFAQMSNLSKKTRSWLSEVAEITLPKVAKRQQSSDGVIKYLFQLDDNNHIESVYIPEEGRATLCISSQVGCALDCSFCSTARQGFNRNLTTAEIIGQIFQVKDDLAQHQLQPLSNIVLMGMGEPLLNYDKVLSALKIMLDDMGFSFSKRRVTVSTAGVVPALKKLADDIDVSLAVSLHSADNALRDELVPLNKKYPLEELMQACRYYLQDQKRKRHIMFEYVMLQGINDQDEHARQLVKLLKGLAAKVNLIPFNPFPGSGYQSSSEQQILRFQAILNQGKIRTLLRKTRGEDVDAACGQLAGKIQDKSRRQRKFIDPRFGEVV